MKFPSSPAAAVLCAALSTALCATAAFAQTSAAAKPEPAAPAVVTGPTKIAIINIEEAISATQEGQKLGESLKSRFAPKRAELDASQKAIIAMQKQLADGGNTMSATAKSDLNNQIQIKERDFQQAADNAQSDYQNAQTELMNTVGNKLMPILKTYAEQHGFTEVLDVSMQWPQNPVLYSNPGADITKEIVKLYDQAHPSAAPAKPSGGQ